MSNWTLSRFGKQPKKFAGDIQHVSPDRITSGLAGSNRGDEGRSVTQQIYFNPPTTFACSKDSENFGRCGEFV